ncbi:Spermidine/putrescine transport system permease protein PotB (plasmid) [Pseudoseohaeicola sp. NH-UV-7]|uniref:ABC transporter permease n=1 Tax=unclassified Sulfitobacter TaxID=196795 RepID=UPI000E0C6784|nr:ABC transporter permease [Sulfitobacter sp. JL08]AXI54365.1 spermidine/putrescine ABC transporter permease [Sulfitobacter sp. JL08]
MNSRLKSAILLGPGLGWLALLMVIPCGLIFTYAFFERGVYGGIDYVFTFENFSRAFDPLYMGIFLQSAKIAGLTTLIAILIAYPAAYAITRAPRQWQTVLLILVILPFWSNYLIRTYAWIVMLNREGLINNSLIGIGVIDDPLPLLYNSFAIVVGLVYNYTPFVVLAIYASLNRINRETIEASQDLGATGWTTFRRVILPQTIPGVAAGGVFVFVLSIGNFITPDLLGGGRLQMVGNLIYDQFLSARDWPFGAALSLFLIAVMMALLFTQAVLANRASGDAGRKDG